MAFFLLVYEQNAGRLMQMTRYPDAEQEAAMAARFALELKHRLEPNIEVVLLGARDEETLRETHARYFKTVGELIANG